MQNESEKKNVTVIPTAHDRYLFSDPNEFAFLKGGLISELNLVYETYGQLNQARDNAILVHHALSTGCHLCASPGNPSPGWWEAMVGPGKTVDTDRFYVICVNNLGSCFGSSGPSSINPNTNSPYGSDFPELTIDDMVIAQHKLLKALSIEKLYAVIGNSMGGMLSLAWSIYFPDTVDRLISISSSYKAYPINIVKHALARDIINLDMSGDRKESLKIARKLAYLDYRGLDELKARFDTADALAGYLDYNAQKFIDYFDTDTYLYLTQAMDEFDASNIDVSRLVSLSPTSGNPFSRIQARSLVISVSSDTLFEPYQQQELVDQLQAAAVDTQFVQHDSDRGHDAFYNDDTIGQHIRQLLE